MNDDDDDDGLYMAFWVGDVRITFRGMEYVQEIRTVGIEELCNGDWDDVGSFCVPDEVAIAGDAELSVLKDGWHIIAKLQRAGSYGVHIGQDNELAVVYRGPEDNDREPLRLPVEEGWLHLCGGQ